jgi:hypothetical protein
MPLPYVPFYQPLPLAPSSTSSPLILDGEAQGTVTPVKSGLKDSGASTPLTSPSPMNPMSTLCLPVLTPHPPFNWGHPTSLCEDPSSPQTPTTLQMPLREFQGPVYYDQHCQIHGGGQTLIYQPFTTTGLLTWKHHIPSFMNEPQALIDLMQSIIQTHKPTWANCRQLLLTLFNTEE